jgi:hypothetical protein
MAKGENSDVELGSGWNGVLGKTGIGVTLGAVFPIFLGRLSQLTNGNNNLGLPTSAGVPLLGVGGAMVVSGVAMIILANVLPVPKATQGDHSLEAK